MELLGGAQSEKWVVLGVLVFVVYALLREIIAPAPAFFIGNMVLLALRILTPADVLAGFANEPIATIVLLVLLTAMLRKNFRVERFFDYFFRRARTPRRFRLQMMVTVATLSSCLNNTPIVAAMTPYVYQWGKKHGVPPSKLLIPLSFATIFGGMITLVGTSTNLVLNGFLLQNGEPLFQLTDFLLPGVLVSATGIAFLTVFGERLLPANRDALDELRSRSREYLVETRLRANANLVGKSIQEAGLRNLPGVYLVEIIRDNRTLSPVAPEEILFAGDRLFFAGQTDRIVELVNEDHGLVLPRLKNSHPEEALEIVECVIPANSHLVGQTVKRTNFRERYDAAIIAVHRNGERMRGKIGDMRLAAGDLLLLTIAQGFARNPLAARELYLISTLKSVPAGNQRRLRLFVLLAPLAVLGLVLGLYSLFYTLLLLLLLAVLLQLITVGDARRAVDIEMVLILVLALSLGNALIKTGAAELLAHQLVVLLHPLGTAAILGGLFVLTVVLTTFVTNAASVAIVFPVAYSVVQDLGLPGMPFYLAIAFGASAAFLTPFGYQTNLMVFGPGSYTLRDFLRIGLPVTLVYSLTCLIYILVRHGLIS